MTPAPESLPVVGRAYRFGVSRVTTTLVLLGPVLLAGIAVAGRNPLTVGLGCAYVLAVPVSIAYLQLSRGVPTDGDDETDRDPDEPTDGG